MAIIDSLAQDAQKAWDFLWLSEARPGTVRNRTLHNYQLRDVLVVPKQTRFNVLPQLQLSSEQHIENDTSVQQSQTLYFEEKTIDSVTTSVTHGFTASTSVTTKTSFDFNFIFGSSNTEVAFNIEAGYNFSSTTTQTSTKERSWKIEQPVIAPPFSKVTATLLVFHGETDVPMDLSAIIQGVRIPEFDYDPPWGNTIYTANFDVLSGAGTTIAQISPIHMAHVSSSYTNDFTNIYNAKWNGTATSRVSSGLYSVVRLVEEPLPGHHGETRTYYSSPILANPSQIFRSDSLDNRIPINNSIPPASSTRSNERESSINNSIPPASSTRGNKKESSIIIP
ncbi:ETX/MTX2 family pore-forming toxin [Bacillus thuringiensis]|nr:ETX/MTX2 family pore-forming toxin [Bacillus thuringiensis]